MPSTVPPTAKMLLLSTVLKPLLDTPLADRVLRWWFKSSYSIHPRIKTVYAFNENADDTYGGYSRVLPRDAFDLHFSTWERVAQKYIPHREWGDRYRLEIRYEYLGKKYRMILRPGDDMDFARLTDTAQAHSRVLLARLMPSDGDDPVNVTARVAKYAGPLRTFDNVRITDMFPFDDHDRNAAHFSCLRIIDGSFRVWDVPYDPVNNPVVKDTGDTPST
jgi:hypothetical protein